MLPIDNKQDKEMFKMVVAYLSAGGTPTNWILKFCHKYQIDVDRLSKELKENKEATMANLRRLNLL